MTREPTRIRYAELMSYRTGIQSVLKGSEIRFNLLSREIGWMRDRDLGHLAFGATDIFLRVVIDCELRRLHVRREWRVVAK